LLLLSSVLLCCCAAQAKTALADTKGSLFLQDCVKLANEGRFDELVKRLSAHLDLVFAKCSEKGEQLHGVSASNHSYQHMQLHLDS
jgi:phosphate-selective porin